jgi:Tol biopolymer transport system component
MRRICGVIALMVFSVVNDGAAQGTLAMYDYVRAGDTWYTIETDHFLVHFHMDAEGRGASRSAQVAARVAEEVYGPITEYYGYRPDSKISIVLKDFEDYSNGAAYFFDNKIEIWAPSLDSPLRGDNNWLRNVIAHEFTHIVQIQAAMKGGRRIPFFYLQWLAYEQERRPDVLYGYPNVIATYPVPVVNVPAWLAEGTAQYQLSDLDYDRWDSHRDMVLRSRVLAGRELSLREMGGFYSHNSLERETVYNQGFAFSHYLVNRFGDDALKRLSGALSNWSSWNVERAMRRAFGVDAPTLYDDWMADLRTSYRDATRAIEASPVAGRLLEQDGFANFTPRVSPDGSRVAYVSNRGQDFSRMALFVRDREGKLLAEHDLGTHSQAVHFCAFGHRLAASVGVGISWLPDGSGIVFSRRGDRPDGSALSDLYRVDTGSGKIERLTRGLRAHEPAVSPDGRQIAFVGQTDGTTNLYLVDVDGNNSRPLTRLDDGTQLIEPTWHPSSGHLYVGISRDGARRLARVDIADGSLSYLTEADSDARNPHVSGDGAFLFYSSDRSGIFNIYRRPLEGSGRSQAVTNVTGGAFMPAFDGERLYFARYDWDGYKLAVLDHVEPVEIPSYLPPASTSKPTNGPVHGAAINTFDDSGVRSLSGPAQAESIGARRYRDTFTSFSIMPVIRLDQYVGVGRGGTAERMTERTAGRALMRNTKVGLYATSREMLDKLSFTGGLMFSPASGPAEGLSDFFVPGNLLKLERDLFLSFEYAKGFGRSASRAMPRLSVDLFNVTRNVNNGLSIEEFPCTACLPDTTYANLTYNLWEFDIAARSRISRTLMLEGGYRYSPYQVTTERFFSREEGATIPSSSARYYIGRSLRLVGHFEAFAPHRNANVLPVGLRVQMGYEYEPGSLLDRFDVEDGVLVSRYEDYRNHRLHLDGLLGYRLPGSPAGGVHGLTLRGRTTAILGSPVESFFNSYVGGLTGARGYPFYALGGNRTGWMQLSYTRPLVNRIDVQAGFLYFDKLYARIYGDVAAAWDGNLSLGDDLRRDVGVEMRLGLGSFYLLPAAFFASATYGFDRFEQPLKDGLLTPDGRSSVTYGQEVLFHFGLLFGFDL